jgi:hypothetical protein
MHKPQKEGFGKNGSLLGVGLPRDGIYPTAEVEISHSHQLN